MARPLRLLFPGCQAQITLTGVTLKFYFKTNYSCNSFIHPKILVKGISHLIAG